MRHVNRFLVATLALGAFWSGAVSRGDDAPASKLSSVQLRLDVLALRALHQFQLDAGQRTALRRLARGCAAETSPTEKNKLSPELRKHLAELRQAFLKADEDRIAEIEDDIEELQDKEKSEWELDLDITATARQKVAEVRRLLSARQVVAFLTLFEEDFPDPLAELLDALHRAPGVKTNEWKAFSETTGELVGRLVAGLDTARIDKVSARVASWLKQARGLTEKELDKRRSELEKEARQIVAGVDPTDVLRNVVDHALAELLSNPRLPPVLDALATR